VDADKLVLDRLEFLRNEVHYLKSERDQALSLGAYTNNVRLRKATERSLHLAIEACLDIGRRLIALNGWTQPENNQAVFQILATEGVVSDTLLPTLLDMTRFRNLIVHDYTRIDDAIVYTILTKRLGDFDAYATAIHAYLQREQDGSEES
jgi:uncharacterized protein YutE (UPF0331/DUF86 family)